MNKVEFNNYLKEICPWVSEHTFELFEIYKSTLQNYNKKMNLSRICNDEQIYDQYFLASLIPFTKLDYFHENINFKILDIGTGSGIPGVVLKIIYPQIKLTLMEANTKKCTFLNELINRLNFNDVEIINSRCEDCVNKYRECFDIVTSRAVASLNKILELSAAFAKVGGSIIALKSQNYLIELNEAKNAIDVLYLSLIAKFETNFANHLYITLDFKKLSQTEEQYPRSWQKIMAKPL